MTKQEFDQIISDHDLYYFDGLLQLTLSDDITAKGVWVTTVPSLDPSNDGTFAGKPEAELFYLMDSDTWQVYTPEEIVRLECLQKGYLKGIPYQMNQLNMQ